MERCPKEFSKPVRKVSVKESVLRETELLEDKGFKLSRSSADFMGLASAAASDGTQKVGATVIAAQRGRG